MRQFFLLIFLIFISRWMVKILRRMARPSNLPRDSFGSSETPKKSMSGNFNSSNTDTSASASADVSSRSHALVLCAVCRVHVPRGESIVIAGHYFCCAAHAERYAA